MRQYHVEVATGHRWQQVFTSENVIKVSRIYELIFQLGIVRVTLTDGLNRWGVLKQDNLINIPVHKWSVA